MTQDYLLNELNQDWKRLDNKVRFILAVVKEEIVVRNRKRADLMKVKKHVLYPGCPGISAGQFPII